MSKKDEKDDTIKKIIKDLGNSNNIYQTKTGFIELIKSDTDNLAKNLIKKISQEISVNKITGYRNAGEYPDDEKLFYHPNKVKSDKKKTNCTIQASRIRKEEILERMIKIASGCNNQIPIPDLKGGSHIDLAIKDGKITNIIELKQWKNTKDNPCYTIAENIKNLYMLLHLAYHYNPDNKYKYQNKIVSVVSGDKNFYEKINDVNKFILTVLAPEEYYNYYFGETHDKTLIEKYKTFCLELEKCIQEDLRDKLNKEDLEIKIEIKQIKLTFDEFETIRKVIIQKAGSKFKDIDEKIYIEDLNDYKDVFNDKENKKKLTEWEDVIK